uniref:multiple epidermal growth factor-like domains protein 11 n=1 Tax=Myxine glutinosa TaxID=7769 RepID=UPI00358E189F
MYVPVLLILLPQLTLALDLKEPNVCSRWESYTVSFLESYAHTYNQVYYTRCTDFLNLFKCTQHRVGYRLVYRQATRTAYRHRPQCCHGFYNKNDTCIPCDADHWGQDCLRLCPCQNGADCDPVSGSCSCLPGFRGRRCQLPCPANTFGPGCSLLCNCRNGGSCDQASGACMCPPGFTGTLCEQACSAHTCGNADKCAQRKQLCLCPPGWTGEDCSLPCPAETFGTNCSMKCNCGHYRSCSSIEGVCPCEKEQWSPDCTQDCTCFNGGTCSPQDHLCICPPGYIGQQCEKECPAGRYGSMCANLCSCSNNSFCDPVDGMCLCPSGWRGQKCSEACPSGFFGQNCQIPCDCGMNITCEPETGACHCQPGWENHHCEAEPSDYARNHTLCCRSPCVQSLRRISLNQSENNQFPRRGSKPENNRSLFITLKNLERAKLGPSNTTSLWHSKPPANPYDLELEDAYCAPRSPSTSNDAPYATIYDPLGHLGPLSTTHATAPCVLEAGYVDMRSPVISEPPYAEISNNRIPGKQTQDLYDAPPNSHISWFHRPPIRGCLPWLPQIPCDQK